MPVAEIIKGTIIGDIRIAIITRFAGIWDWLRPIAANVPNETDIMVASGAMIIEFQNDLIHSPLESCRMPRKSA